MYQVVDTTGHPIRWGFRSWKEAYSYIIMCQRYDWTIEEY